jgi:hypothetical protein
MLLTNLIDQNLDLATSIACQLLNCTSGSKLTEIDKVSGSLIMSGLSRLALATSSTPWVHSLNTSVSYLDKSKLL